MPTAGQPFVPPSPDQWQGPAQTSGFVPPPVSAWQGPATNLGLPAPSGKPATLPDVSNEDIKGWGRTALNYAPAVGATIGALTQPEFIPAIGAAMLGGAGGSAVKQGVLAATKQPDAPQSFNEAAGEVGKDALTQGALEAGGRAIAKPLEYVAGRIFSPRTMYQSALKPGTALDKGLPGSVSKMEGQKRVATGLREGIPTSEAGYEKATGKINEINRQIGGVINQPSVRLVDPLDVAQRLDSLEQYYGKQALPAADQASIRQAKIDYLTKHGAKFDDEGKMLQPPNMMSPIEAQEEKVATYQQNRKKFGQLSPAGDESEKALAHGLKEELVKIYPELSALNERDSALYGLEQSLRRFIGREGNKNLVGLIPAVLGTGAGVVAGHGPEGAAAGMLAGALMALDSPPVKSSVAIALSRAAQTKIGRAAAQLTPTRVLPALGRVGTGLSGQPQTVNINPNAVPAFAKGGIIRKPMIGLVGEAGPEMIAPVESVNPAILNALPSPGPVERTSAQPTVPEQPEALASQVQQLTAGKRRVVMFPKGTPSQRMPKGMKVYRDEDGNRYIYHPKLISEGKIRNAISTNNLPSILGAAKGGMGAPDKSKLKGNPVNVAARGKDGVAVQSSATDAKHLSNTIRQAKKIAPRGGKVSVEPPSKEIAARLRAR